MNKRASKFSLEKETELTHFGKRINEMSKTELRSAYIGSGDEEEQPFSYDGLIANCKEERAAARRQKMEAEAELEDLDGSFMGMITKLERRDIDADKLANGIVAEDDDLAFMARAFQMDNIRKANAGDRTLTEGEKQDMVQAQVRESHAARGLASRDAEYREDEEEVEEDGDVIVESDSDAMEVETPESGSVEESSNVSDLASLIERLIASPESIPSSRDELVTMARSTPSSEIFQYFKDNFFTPLEGAKRALTPRETLLIKLITMMFPLDHLRHSIVVPTIKVLETALDLNICHLRLFADLLLDSPKYSSAYLALASRLYREAMYESMKQSVLELAAEFCANFTREALSGPLAFYFPEIVGKSDEPFVPIRLHHFKPVEVPSLEPAFHENGTEWNGDHRELREAKKMERQYKQEKKLTVKEMRREAHATEAFHAIQKNKEKQKIEAARKRTESIMQQAEQNWRLTKTDQGKDDKRKMKSRKKPRRGK